MEQIISIVDRTLTIKRADGTLVEYTIDQCTFIPSVGDVVEVVAGPEKVVINRAKTNPAVTQSPSSNAYAVSDVHQHYSHQTHTHTVCDYTQAHGPQHVVSQGVYVLLALLLGTFGVHKFYAGRVGLGILYLILALTLILAFIPAFIALIEAIIAATKQPDCFGKIIA